MQTILRVFDVVIIIGAIIWATHTIVTATRKK